jgi:hypothetical protein
MINSGPGEFLPHFDIGPVETLDDVMAFDRKVCSECKRFMRDFTDVERAEFEGSTGRTFDGYTLITVTEIAPGVRTRSVSSGVVLRRGLLGEG